MLWVEFAGALTAFFLSHSLLLRPRVRTRIVNEIGRIGFSFTYSLLSVAVLVWLIAAASRAPYIELWQWKAWQSNIVLFLILLAFLIFVLAIGRPNPFSFGGVNNEKFDPFHPGIVRLTRHPMLTAIAIWSLAHIIPNGNLAHVILFGCFGFFALLGKRIIDRRKTREIGFEIDEMRRQISSLPASSAMDGFSTSFLFRVLLAVSGYFIVLWLHPLVIGVDPIAGG